ncbi:MAG: lysylphosphatidylglycerol synthase domain-containing protein [Candidatus Binataceae bacterium]
MGRIEKFIVRFETFAVLVSLGFYIWFLRRFGLGQIYGYLKLAAWGLCLTVALESISRIANTFGWRVTILDYPRRLRFRELFAARIAGEAIDYITPTAQLGGQPVMATMVRRKLTMAVGLATVSIAALTEAIGQLGFITAALVIAIPLVAKVHSLFWPLIGGMTLAISLAAGFFYVQTKRPFELLRRAASGLMPLLNDPELKDGAAQADAVLADIYAHHRGRVVISSLCYLVAWSMGPVEIYILLRLLHQPVPLLVPLAVEAVGLLIERATFLIPAKLVSQEGGKALILALLGYPAGVGFVVGLLRRIKEMAWVLFGLSAFAIHRLGTQRETQEAGAREARSAAVLRAQGEQSL